MSNKEDKMENKKRPFPSEDSAEAIKDGKKSLRGVPNNADAPKKSKKKQRQEERSITSEREFSDFAARRSIHNLPMKLLILDLNKVLLYRTKGSDRFVPRPHVVSFLKDMAQRFVLAVWTSMKKPCGHRVMRDLFDCHGIPLLFAWYQTRCVAEYKKEPSSSSQTTITASTDAMQEDRETAEPPAVQEERDTTEPPIAQEKKQHAPYWEQFREKRRQKKLHKLGLVVDGKGDTAEAGNGQMTAIDKSQKPIFHKPLQHVWREYPYFGEHNTILLDDTQEKCVTNNEFNCVHPQPFELNITRVQFDVIFSRPDCKLPLPTNDCELEPQGKLWAHLDAISQFDGTVKQFYDTHDTYVAQKPATDGMESDWVPKHNYFGGDL